MGWQSDNICLLLFSVILLFSIVKMKVLLICALTTLVASQPFFEQFPSQVPDFVTLRFSQFQTKYSKRYQSEEEKLYRGIVFRNNKAKINSHNMKPEKTYTEEENQFLDMSEEEFSALYNTLIQEDAQTRQYINDLEEKKRLDKENCDCKVNNAQKRQNVEARLKQNQAAVEAKLNKKAIEKMNQKDKTASNINSLEGLSTIINVDDLPEDQVFTDPLEILNGNSNSNANSNAKIPTKSNSNASKKGRLLMQSDWTSFAGPVRHQYQCGACFAFATVNAMEALYAKHIFGGFYFEFSVQQVIDCAMYPYDGCNGGLLHWSMAYLKYSGITSAFQYPYTSGPTGTFSGQCKSQAQGDFKVVSYLQIDESCSQIERQLLNKPIAVAIFGGKLQFYGSGVFNGCAGSTIVLDHAVLLVGSSPTNGWRIKNTWGTIWGQDGYAWISSIESENCGLCKQAIVPTIATG